MLRVWRPPSRAISNWLGDEFYGRIRHIHLSDFVSDRRDHLPLGYGTVPYCEYLSRVSEAAQAEVFVVLEIDFDKAAAFGNPVGGVVESVRRLDRCVVGAAPRV